MASAAIFLHPRRATKIRLLALLYQERKLQSFYFIFSTVCVFSSWFGVSKEVALLYVQWTGELG